MNKTKKVYFYKVNITKKSSSIKEKLKPSEIKDFLSKIPEYNTNGKPFSYELKYDSENTVVEFIDTNSSGNGLFGRIGKKEDLNYLHIRSHTNHKSSEIDIPSGSYAEKFTYFYYNLETGILSFLSILGAPNYGKFKKFLIELFNDSNDVMLLPVSNQNIIEFLKKKDILSGFSLQTTVPVDEFLGCDNLGLSRSTFVDLENAELITIDISVKGKRKKNISKEYNGNIAIIDKIHSLCKSSPRVKAKIKAQNSTEKVQSYSIIDEFFTYSIDLPDIKENTLFSKAMQNALITAYNNSIDAILQMAK